MSIGFRLECPECGGTKFFVREWSFGGDDPPTFTGFECMNPKCWKYKQAVDAIVPRGQGEPSA